jgi:Mo-co oxidoreductase dimerisation domain
VERNYRDAKMSTAAVPGRLSRRACRVVMLSRRSSLLVGTSVAAIAAARTTLITISGTTTFCWTANSHEPCSATPAQPATNRTSTASSSAPAKARSSTSSTSSNKTLYRIQGYAYDGGGHEIQCVELSLDNGKTWLYCIRKSSPTSPSATAINSGQGSTGTSTWTLPISCAPNH